MLKNIQTKLGKTIFVAATKKMVRKSPWVTIMKMIKKNSKKDLFFKVDFWQIATINIL